MVEEQSTSSRFFEEAPSKLLRSALSLPLAHECTVNERIFRQCLSLWLPKNPQAEELLPSLNYFNVVFLLWVRDVLQLKYMRDTDQ
jgi:hypothetical protein